MTAGPPQKSRYWRPSLGASGAVWGGRKCTQQWDVSDVRMIMIMIMMLMMMMITRIDDLHHDYRLIQQLHSDGRKWIPGDDTCQWLVIIRMCWFDLAATIMKIVKH
jgi:hypothetical protein